MTDKPSILIVDDDVNVLRTMKAVFADDYIVLTADSGAEALTMIPGHPELCCTVLDIRMAKMDGLETATQIAKLNSELPIIFHTGYPGDYSERSIDETHQPFDYVIKGDRPERLRRAVRNAVEYAQLRRRTTDLVKLGRDQYAMIGGSPAMLEVYRTIQRVAPTDLSVLILGATGTGKELVAQAIHAHSGRRDQPIRVLNCNHTPKDLVASKLFGHRKGSFSGAIADHTGLFELADGGTLFLDEIGDMNMETQGLLLRAVEQGEIEPIGAEQNLNVDVRLVCATNRNLKELTKSGTFREDLYARLAQVAIEMAPLQSRIEDIPPLIDHFLERAAQRPNGRRKQISADAQLLLCVYDWPHNVRELETTINVLVEMTPSDLITADDVRRQLGLSEEAVAPCRGLRAAERAFRTSMINRALSQHSGNVAATARDLLIDRANLRRMMTDLDIDGSQFDSVDRSSAESG